MGIKNFCVMTVGRSGSTSLMESLHQYDIAFPSHDVNCEDDELLHPDRVLQYAGEYGRLIGQPISNSTDLVDAFYRYHAKSPFAGFKSMPDRHPDFSIFIARKDIQFISLIRQDIPSTVASFLVALEKRSWRRHGEPYPEMWRFDEQRHGQRALANLAYILKGQAAINSMPSAIRLTYEELVAPGFSNGRLDELFGRSIRIDNPRPPTHGSDYVENWEEFTAWLARGLGASGGTNRETKASPEKHNQVLDYFRRVNHDLLRLMPYSAKTALELGCGAGLLGEIYKRRNPACRYFGVELDAVAADEASSRIDQVWQGDVELFSPEALGIAPNTIDCLIYGDILEHLRDPWQLLRRHVDLLSPDGVAIACIPNIQHWSVLAELLRGKFKYQPEGLLDRTHLRFFTLESVLEMFKDAGLHVLDVRARKFHNTQFDQFYQTVLPVLDALQVDKNEFRAQASAFQYVVRAVRTPPVKPMLVHSRMLKPVAGCNDVRIMHINECLATIPGVSVLQETDKASFPRTNIKDKIFIWQRPILTHADQARLEAIVAAGYIVVIEFDDHPMRWPAIEQNGYLTFKGVHAIQTSTPALGNFFRQINPEVAVFPNQLKELPPLPKPRSGTPVTVFFGALNREDDWKPLMASINDFTKRNAGKVRFEVIHDRTFFDALETNDKLFTPTCAYDRYREIMASCDIALLPLVDNDFNRMKSDLKFIEAAAFGTVVIASPTVYASSIIQGKTGLIYCDEAEFSGHLQRLLDDEEFRLSIRTEAYQYVASQRLMSQHVMGRLDWYRSLLQKRKELEEKRRARLLN